MTAALAPFDFHGQAIRVIVGEDGEPWFMAGGVCSVLDLLNVSQAVSRLAEDERSTITSNEGGPERLIVSEAGLYRLIFTSRKDEAETFRRWVTHTVLPEIRRTGTYGQPALPTTVDAGMLRQIASAMEAKDARIAELEPAAAVAEAISGSAGDMSVREAAQTLARDHGIDTGQMRLFKRLRELRWIDSQGRAYQAQLECGRLSVRTTTYDHPHTGEPMLSTQLRVTGKGLRWLHEHWNDGPIALRALPGGVS